MGGAQAPCPPGYATGTCNIYSGYTLKTVVLIQLQVKELCSYWHNFELMVAQLCASMLVQATIRHKVVLPSAQSYASMSTTL